MAHSLSRGCCGADDQGANGLGEPVFDVVGRILFHGPADLADQYHLVGFRVVVKQTQNIYEIGADYGVAADAYTTGLTNPQLGELGHRFVG